MTSRSLRFRPVSITRTLLPLSFVAALAGCGGEDATPGQTGPGTGAGGKAGSAGLGGSAGKGPAGSGGASAGRAGYAGTGGRGGALAGAGGSSGKASGGEAGKSGGSGTSGSGGDSGAGEGGGTGGGGASGSGGLGGGGAAAGSAGSGGVAGSGGDPGGGGEGGAGPSLVIERSGVRLRGPIVDLSVIGRELWIGTNALPDLYDPATMRAGLHRLSLDDGNVKTFEKELPVANYGFPGEPPVLGPVATAGVSPALGKRLAVSRGGLVSIDEKLFATPRTITVDGETATPTHLVTDEARKLAFLSTNKGLVTLDLKTLAVKSFASAASLGGVELGALALDGATGAVFVVAYDAEGKSRVVRVLGAAKSALVPGTGTTPTGTVVDVVFSDKTAKLYVAIQSFQATSGGVVEWDGEVARTLAIEGALAKSVNGEPGPFGPRTLALDETDGVLVIGGDIAPTTPLGPLVGGGLVFLRLSDLRMTGALAGERIAAIAVDDQTRRFYVSSQFPCSEVKLRNKGLVALSFDKEGRVRVERPLLSGVRDIAETKEGVVVGLRDDKPGFGCDGYPIQTGLYALRSNRSGELLPLTSSTPDVSISRDAGPVVLDVSTEGKLAVGTFGDANFIGAPGKGAVIAPTEQGTSNFTYDIAFSTPATVWVGGRATHVPNDPPKPNIGPRGAARLTLGGDGQLVSSQRFTRGSDDPADIVGLPSGEVRGTLVAADGSIYLLCATERSTQNTTDREEGSTYVLDGKTYLGGIARITGDAIAAVTDSTTTPDPRAGAFAVDGRLVVADAKVGVVALTKLGGPGPAVVTPVPGVADLVPSGAIPTSVWVGAGTDLVVTYDKGVYRSFGGEKTYSARDGYSWRARGVGASVLIGSEDGLSVLRVAGQPALSLPAVVKGALPPFQ